MNKAAYWPATWESSTTPGLRNGCNASRRKVSANAYIRRQPIRKRAVLQQTAAIFR
jgi:hypothetical protein